eukprot:CAMPEP_0194271158 /NCGR_PEP_ID=MMETSP0169-20130528/5013_1 /TAXON_ID=218684 /ORGANISM="Corethron pennatum, Strain L29A3" /LENGTH=62 /DNA_ID=CAMNT_0039013443 /DNA_START=860 /DNA_END=1048 /DNA_ORIENTATION=-
MKEGMEGSGTHDFPSAPVGAQDGLFAPEAGAAERGEWEGQWRVTEDAGRQAVGAAEAMTDFE